MIVSEMNMREKMARAVAAVGDVPRLSKVWNDKTGRENAYKFVDAALNAMMSLTDSMNDAMADACDEDRCQRGFMGEIWQSAIQAIKDGK